MEGIPPVRIGRTSRTTERQRPPEASFGFGSPTPDLVPGINQLAVAPLVGLARSVKIPPTPERISIQSGPRRPASQPYSISGVKYPMPQVIRCLARSSPPRSVFLPLKGLTSVGADQSALGRVLGGIHLD